MKVKNNVVSLLEKHSKEQPDKVAFYYLTEKNLQSQNFEHESMTYSDFNNKVGVIAGGLVRAGVKRGDRIIVYTKISPELYLSIAGLQRLGAIPVLLDSLSRKEQLDGIVKNSQPVGIIAASELFHAFGDTLSSLNIKIHISESGINCESDKKAEIAAVKGDDTALITYTTGSSGTPKGVDRTHRFLFAQHHALKRLFPYKSGDIDLPVFPVFALNNLASGISTVIPAIDISRPRQKDSETLVSQIKACEVNCMTLSPSSVCNIADYCCKKKEKLKGISRVLAGGAPISEADISKFMGVVPNSKNWILYGSTEVEPISFIESRKLLSAKPPSRRNSTEIGLNVGKIDRLLKYKLIDIKAGTANSDVKDLEVRRGEIGEMIVSGENVCSSYFRNKKAFAATKILDQDGTVWHRTGDLVREDNGGFFWVVGRKHNVIKSGNELFFPVRPEIMLKDLPNVINAAYLGVDFERENKVFVVLTLENATKENEESCSKKITNLFKKEKLPLDKVVFMGEIPMDVRHHSKVDYTKLRKRLHELLA